MSAMVLIGSPFGSNCCEDAPPQAARTAARPKVAARWIYISSSPFLPYCFFFARRLSWRRGRTPRAQVTGSRALNSFPDWRINTYRATRPGRLRMEARGALMEKSAVEKLDAEELLQLALKASGENGHEQSITYLKRALELK